ncbi:MAG: dTDP-4-amino-4,6-dideoxygalactose transaminase [Bdellovibrionales bacterium]|nr:dTDP-4-amino-4,6-dideoxygalactose transaminase [Bdellovibrionales bacterium]
MIPFNKAHISGKELFYIAQAVTQGELKGDGPFTKKCHTWLEERFGILKALLTHSCTGALEMAAILADIQKGDEVIMSSFTFTSTANAFLLRGAKPIFCEIREDTLNIDETQIEALITERTKAIVPMHYAGVGCEMDAIMEIAQRHNLVVIEDAAHAIMAKYRGEWLGSIGDIGTFSFHETKNYSSGEGGALLLKDPELILRSEIIREKGTNRSQFFRGQVDKYSWVDVGSSYLPSEIIAAFLYGQLENADEINDERLAIWSRYHEAFETIEEAGDVRRPIIPSHCEHNAHMYYLLLDSLETRTDFISHCAKQGSSAVFHYVPLHLSPMGRRLGNRAGQFPITEELSDRLVRLPLYCGLSREDQAIVCSAVRSYFSASQRTAVPDPMVANL